MIWGSFGEFIHMGGYGLYVWGSYLVTFALMIAEVIALRSRRRTNERRLSRNRMATQEKVNETET